MIRGLYTAASSMLAAGDEMNTVSNNLANVGTAGYKRAEPIRRSFREMLIQRIDGKQPAELGYLGTGVALEGTYTSFKQGQFRYTGNELDLALDGRGFFVVQTPGGRCYTRSGSFTVDERGRIVTQAGYPVLGRGGFLEVDPERGLEIDGSGRLHYDDLPGDRLLVVDFRDLNLLTRVGENLYQIKEEGGGAEEREVNPDSCRLKPGYLEESNVNIVREMARMIEVSRSYEANQKVINSLDQTLDKAVNSVGRLS